MRGYFLRSRSRFFFHFALWNWNALNGWMAHTNLLNFWCDTRASTRMRTSNEQELSCRNSSFKSTKLIKFKFKIEKRKRDLPSRLMPTAMHFFSRQYWQRLRLMRKMLHCWFFVHGRYWIFCWMDRLKNPYNRRRENKYKMKMENRVELIVAIVIGYLGAWFIFFFRAHLGGMLHNLNKISAFNFTWKTAADAND